MDLVNSVEGIVWEADTATFSFSFVSEQAERILGYLVEQWIREPTFWRDHLHPEDRDWAAVIRVVQLYERVVRKDPRIQTRIGAVWRTHKQAHKTHAFG
jgi:PAS domain-containing protein